MSENQSSYRQIFKATSLFGGVQIINIIIQIVRSKIIAVFLGPAGMGIAGLLTTALSLVGGISNFGLGISSVRDISESSLDKDEKKLSKVYSILTKLIWITGLLGSILAFIIAPLLSYFTFGNYEYSNTFRFLAITLLFNQVASGELAVLQGLRKLKLLAKATVLGSLGSLIISTPLYYLYGIDGIVPAIIISSIISVLIAFIYTKNIRIVKIQISKVESIKEGKSMLRMGFMLSISGLLAISASYIIRAYIGITGSIEDVGFYSAGFAIISSYVGMIFTAMSTDYYPRLSAVAKDHVLASAIINQQAIIALLIIGPILCIFLVFSSWAVILLYSIEFSPINSMIQWAAVGMYFKAASFSISYLFLAKGASKLFFWNEIIANSYTLILNVVFYNYFGLNGLGISFMLCYILYLLQVYFVTKNKYNFKFERSFYRIFFFQCLLGMVCFLLVSYFEGFYIYAGGLIAIISALIVSFYELNKRLNLSQIVKQYIKKKHL